MSCEFYKELIFKKLDNEINDEEEKVLLDHLKNCIECQTDFKQLSDIEDILNSQPMLEIPQSFSRAVVDKIKQPQKKRFFFRPIATVAAACIILVLAFYSHAFDNLLSTGNIVQKNNTDKASGSLQEDINKKLQDDDKEKMSSYVQNTEDKSTGNVKKPDSINQNKPSDAKQVDNSQTQIQKQPENTETPVLKSTVRAKGAGSTSSQEPDGTQAQDNAGTEASQENYGTKPSEDTQTETSDSTKMFGALSSTAAAGDQSSYNAVVTAIAGNQEVLDILKNYTVTQKSEFEFEILKSEYDKVYLVLQSKNIKVEIKELNINSDIVLLVITK